VPIPQIQNFKVTHYPKSGRFAALAFADVESMVLPRWRRVNHPAE
jgi:hypothetical protein